MKNKSILIAIALVSVLLAYAFFTISIGKKSIDREIEENPVATIITKQESKNVEDKVNPDTKSLIENDLLESHYLKGSAAFQRSMKNLFNSWSFILEDGSNLSQFFKKGDIREIAVQAISNLDQKQSHTFLRLADLYCEYVNLSGSRGNYNVHQTDLNDLDENVPAEDRRFYEGFKSAHEEFIASKVAECNDLKDTMAINQDAINSNMTELFGTDSWVEIEKKLNKSELSHSQLMQMTGINIDPKHFEVSRLSQKVFSNDKSEKTSAITALYKINTQDHQYYLKGPICRYRGCGEHLGKENYEKYLETGAYLGDSSTLIQYVSYLDADYKSDEALAWLKYSRFLNKEGCISSFGFINRDIGISEEVRRRMELLDNEQKTKIGEIYQSLIKKHFNKAKSIIGC